MEEGIAVKSVKILDILPTIAEDRGTPGREDRTRLAQSLLRRRRSFAVLISNPGFGKPGPGFPLEIALTAPNLRTAKEAEGKATSRHPGLFLDPAPGRPQGASAIPSLAPAVLLQLAIAGRDYKYHRLSDQLNAPHPGTISQYQMDKALAHRSVNIPLEELHLDRASSVQGLVEACQTAVQEDHARALVFGCTCFSPLADLVRQELQSRGIQVPIIESLRATLLDAFSCVMQGISQSQSTYRPVREKPRRLDWNENGQISGGISKKAEACV